MKTFDASHLYLLVISHPFGVGSVTISNGTFGAGEQLSAIRGLTITKVIEPFKLYKRFDLEETLLVV